MAFVLSIFVPNLSFFWCLGKAVIRDCGISLVSSHIFGLYASKRCDLSLKRQSQQQHTAFKLFVPDFREWRLKGLNYVAVATEFGSDKLLVLVLWLERAALSFVVRSVFLLMWFQLRLTSITTAKRKRTKQANKQEHISDLPCADLTNNVLKFKY